MRARSNSTRLEHTAEFPSRARWLTNGRSIRSARRPLLSSRPTIRSWVSEHGCAHCVLRCERSVPSGASEFSDVLGAYWSLPGQVVRRCPRGMDIKSAQEQAGPYAGKAGTYSATDGQSDA